jgi:hypothetical protein
MGETYNHESGTQNREQVAGSTADKLQEVYNKILDFWNLVDTSNSDVVMGNESRLREKIRNVEVFRVDFTTFRTGRRALIGRVFICVKNCRAVGRPEFGDNRS